MKIRSQLLVVIIFVVITLFIAILLAIIQENIRLNAQSMVLPQLAPGFAFLIIRLVFSGLHNRVDLKINKLIVFKLIMALSLPFFLILVGYLTANFLGFGIEISKEINTIIPNMILGIIMGAIGEELGWRGFLQPQLERTKSMFTSSLIVGSLWGSWHISNYQNGVVFMIAFLVFTISASYILAWVLRNTNYNLILSVLFHVSINLGFLLFFKNVLNNTTFLFINAGLWLITALIIFVLKQKNFVINLK